MEKLALIILFSLASISIGAQNKISFAYDSCGNRINKTILLTKSSVSATAKPFVEMIGKREVKIYPNPTKGILKVEIPDKENTNNGMISVYNAQGRLITRKKIDSFLDEIDISSAANGLYIMQINIGEEVSSWKIIKE